MASGHDNAPPLGGRDAGPGSAEVATAAQAYFNEDQYLVGPADQIDLAAAHPEIPLNNALTATFKIMRGQRFSFAAARRGGIVRLCIHAANYDRRIISALRRADAFR